MTLAKQLREASCRNTVDPPSTEAETHTRAKLSYCRYLLNTEHTNYKFSTTFCSVMKNPVVIALLVIGAFLDIASCFCPEKLASRSVRLRVLLNDKQSSGYDETDAASKGFVSSLTNFVNFFGKDDYSAEKPNESPSERKNPPRSPKELMDRIRDDYTVKNYLWTGDIDLSAFDERCRFTDPTLSFTGTDQFVNNLKNLRPIVDALVRPGGCKSDLLDIQLNKEKGYVQSRWNMVGELDGIPWKPKIDVIGRTKFWYEKNDEGSHRVVFYDEEWEIPAAKALLQLITPAGMISNS